MHTLSGTAAATFNSISPRRGFAAQEALRLLQALKQSQWQSWWLHSKEHELHKN
jgi:hypothetical protein